MRHPLHLLLICILVLFFQKISSAAIKYVKPVVSGTGGNSSMAYASANLQAMANTSSVSDEVWVAVEIYNPARIIPTLQVLPTLVSNFYINLINHLKIICKNTTVTNRQDFGRYI